MTTGLLGPQGGPTPKVIDRDGPIPLYHLVSEAIRRDIDEGRFPPRSQLPTEEELGAAFRVSRTTVREALRALAQRGLIEKRQGRGTFVSDAKIEELLPSLSSFSAEMEARGLSVRTNVLDVEVVSPPGRVRDAMHLPPRSAALRVVRQRFIDEKPVVVSTSFLPDDLSPDEDFGGSIYALLEERCGLAIASGTATVEAGLAGEYEATFLDILVGAPVLNISWLGRTPDGVPVEFSEATYRGDSYRYIIRLERSR